MSNKGQYRKIPEFSLKFLVGITMCIQRVLTGFKHYMVEFLWPGWAMYLRRFSAEWIYRGSFQKLLRISRGWRQSMKPSMKSFWVRGPGWLHELYTHDAGLVCNTLVRNIFLFIFYIWRRKKSKLWKYYQPASNVTDCELWIWCLKIVEPDLGTSTLNHCKRK